MAKEYMVGTLDDKPLLMVNLGADKYFVDEETNDVFLDAPNLPEVKEVETIAAVLAAAGLERVS